MAINHKSGFTPNTRHILTRKQFVSGLTTAVALTFAPRLSAEPRPDKPAQLAQGVSPFDAEEIATGIFVHTGAIALYAPSNGGDISNAGFIIGDDAVAVIDTGGTFKIGSALHDAIRKKTDRPIRYVINTHMHPDHVFGNAAFESEGTQFIAHHKMARGLAARAERYLAINKENVGADAFAGTRVVLPTHGIKQTETVELGGRVLTLEPQPTAHTDNDLVITDEKTKTMFMGDLLFSGHCPTIDGSILGWLRVIKTLRKKTAVGVVPGHGPAKMKWPDAIGPQEDYLKAITTQVRRLISEGKTLSEAMASAAQDHSSNWVLFDEFHRRNVSVAFAELEWE